MGVEECGVVRRLAYCPLSVGVEEVVAEDVDLASFGSQASSNGSEVPHCVVTGRSDGGVMGGPPPVLSPADLDLAVLILLWYSERRSRYSRERRRRWHECALASMEVLSLGLSPVPGVFLRCARSA